ncbi:MAG TPA: GxxExxY protein [Candidatus Synoicihabitans sp.]|nr:GxxExxY protein [Candidatus Synoicihabitans sp.]
METPIDPLHQQSGYEFMAAAFEVYNELGHGFLEEVYQESLELELTLRRIPFQSRPRLTLHYKNIPLKKQYEADLIVINEIVVELKAVKALLPEHEAQLLNYLKATHKRVGYIVNFGANPKLEWKRRVV